MNKLYYYILTLIGTLFSFTTINAQNSNLIFYRDSITGCNTIIHNVTFAESNIHLSQYKIAITLNGKIVKEFRADQITGYRKGKKLYYSKKIKLNGNNIHVLLNRVYAEDSIYIYEYVDNNENKILYAETPKDSILLIPLVNDKNKRDFSYLRKYLDKYPISQDNEVKSYLNTMKNNINSFYSRHMVCITENTNHIIKFRWGLTAGVGFSNLKTDTYSFGNKMNGYIGVFADIPIVQGLSLYAEGLFIPYGFSCINNFEKSISHTVYNRTDITSNLLIRHSFRKNESKWIPYIQLGPQISFPLSKDMKSQIQIIDNEGFTQVGYESFNLKTSPDFGFILSGGVEYKFQTNHSLFFELRYRQNTGKENINGLYLSLSYNL
ncbi:MAG: PorT family protein [Bacteroides sp.]|nr:PorT family protein [Bacteroides sp.]